MACIYNCMMDSSNEVYSIIQGHQDVPLEQDTDINESDTERFKKYIELRSVVYASALFAERLRPCNWTNKVMRKLIKAKIANTKTLKGLITRRCLNT